jgi:hypothetical protein
MAGRMSVWACGRHWDLKPRTPRARRAPESFEKFAARSERRRNPKPKRAPEPRAPQYGSRGCYYRPVTHMGEHTGPAPARVHSIMSVWACGRFWDLAPWSPKPVTQRRRPSSHELKAAREARRNAKRKAERAARRAARVAAMRERLGLGAST